MKPIFIQMDGQRIQERINSINYILSNERSGVELYPMEYWYTDFFIK